MFEAPKKIVTRQLRLHETHVRFGATMVERDGWTVPASYGDELFEYAAVREKGAGLIDLSPRARFLVSGSEAAQFLNGLITNDTSLEENRWMPAAFPNVQGRLIASVRVARLKDGFLIDTEPVTHEKVFKTIERFTLAGDFRVDDVTDRTTLLSLQGQAADGIAKSTFGEAIINTPTHGLNQLDWQQHEMTILRATHTGEDGFDLMVNKDQAEMVWDTLVNAGARPVGYDALERLRIEAGLPRYGIDMDESNVVTEALEEAVSYTKGCYVGQEIIARIKYRGHVAKKLVGIEFDRAVKLDGDSTIRTADAKDVGRITSFTLSPHLGRTIALGYVKYDYVAPGTEVKVHSLAEDVDARVSELPFVRRSSPL